RHLPGGADGASARPAGGLPRGLPDLMAHAARRYSGGIARAERQEVERRPRRVRRGRHAGRHPVEPPAAGGCGCSDRRPRADRARLLRRAGAARDGGARAAGGDAVMERGRMVGAGLAGGLVAGAMVGAAEALAVWFHAHGAGETPALGWALLAYGLIGGAGGLGLGIVAAIVGIDGFALAFAAVGVGLAGVVGRFRVIRDVFLEQLPSGRVPLAVQGVAALMLLGIAVGLWRALSGVAVRRRFVTRPGVAVVS